MKTTVAFTLTCLPLLVASVVRAESLPLPRSTPESQGVSSAHVRAFVEAADQQVQSMHSFMLVRHGQVVAEGWWKPESAEKPHVLWSLSKSFTSTAVGLAVADGKLDIDDKVLKFFPEDAPAEPSENLKAMRVRDLLTMSTGHESQPPLTDDDVWTKKFLSHPVPHQPGSTFRYNTPATYMQSAIVQKLTGQTVLDYLRSRLFEPLGIDNPEWKTSPQGVSLGGYGLYVRTEDIAKFGQLYLQKGMWNGKQLIPADWIAAATSNQVANDQAPSAGNPDWREGYGFQFWQCRHGAYRGDGKDGQFCIVLPEQDAVIAMTAETRNMQGQLDLVWEHLLPAFHGEPLPENEAELGKLRETFSGLKIAGAETATTNAFVPQPPEGFRAIFNGADLTGWYGLNPHSVAKLTGEKKEANLAQQRSEFPNNWTVENGELVNDGHGPYATTEEEFGDMEFLIDYKTVAGADSGIYLRGLPQVQIWDWHQVFDPKNPTRRPHLGSGGLFNNTPGTLGRDPIRFADKPFGQWNQFRIRQIGARTWVWLNSVAVVEGAVMENYEDRTQPLPAKGPIRLQTHGGEIRWRNIFVREIGEDEAQQFLAANPPLPNPTHYDVAYGPHSKQLIHFWQAESDQPTPVLLFIHGGGWMNGGRLSGLTAMLPTMLEAGISVASVEYRFIPEATDDGVVPPVKGPLHDAARALQFVRSKAAEWNIDKQRIGASGGSAGACSSLWLAFHPDMADASSDDPVARESTRLWCAAVTGAQTTLDPQQMKEWTPNSRYGGHAFGFQGDAEKKLSQFDEFLTKRDTILPWIAEYSPYALVTSDDPPVHLFYSAPPALGQPQKDPTHTSNFGVKLQEHCQSTGVECELVYPDAPEVQHSTTSDYLIWKLKP